MKILKKALHTALMVALAIAPLGAAAGNAGLPWNAPSKYALSDDLAYLDGQFIGLVENPMEPTPPMAPEAPKPLLDLSTAPLEEIPSPSTEDADNGFIVINVNINNSGNNNGNGNGNDFEADVLPLVEYPIEPMLSGVSGEAAFTVPDWITLPYADLVGVDGFGLTLIQAMPTLF